MLFRSAYKLDGREITFFPSEVSALCRVRPVYETLSGWEDDLSGVSEFDSLVSNAREYIKAVEEIVGRNINIIGVGPKRSQVIFRR